MDTSGNLGFYFSVFDIFKRYFTPINHDCLNKKEVDWIKLLPILYMNVFMKIFLTYTYTCSLWNGINCKIQSLQNHYDIEGMDDGKDSMLRIWYYKTTMILKIYFNGLMNRTIRGQTVFICQYLCKTKICHTILTLFGAKQDFEH